MVFNLFLLIPLIILVLVLLWCLHMRKYKDIARLPGPSMLQMIANLFVNKSAKEAFGALVNLNIYYGPVVKLWLNPFKPLLIVSDVKYVEFLLTSTVHIDKSDFYKLLMTYVGNGLGSSSGETWKLHRKLLNPAFHNKNLEEYVLTFEKQWSKLVAELKPKEEESVDVFPILCKYTLRILCTTLLEQKEIHIGAEYSSSRANFYTIMMERLLSTLKRNDFIYSFTTKCKKEADCVRTMNKYATRMIEICRTEYLNSPGVDLHGQPTMMSILFTQNFSESDILGHVNTMIEAGYDTTSTTLSFTFFELAKHAEIQQKILEETNLILGPDKDAEITFHDIQKLQYVECVLKEVMRMYVTVPFYERKFKEDVVIDGVKIPKGTDVSICSYNLHRSAEYFPNPEKFDPERFAPENEVKIPTYAYVPFSAGPRHCIGKHFAMLEMKSAIAKIVRHFELYPAEHELDIFSEFVLKSDNGMRIKLKSR